MSDITRTRNQYESAYVIVVEDFYLGEQNRSIEPSKLKENYFLEGHYNSTTRICSITLWSDVIK